MGLFIGHNVCIRVTEDIRVMLKLILTNVKKEMDKTVTNALVFFV